MAKDSQSQLKRLKSALRDSGVSRDAKAKKGPRKNRVDREKELAKIRERFNPYETQVNRSKFAVGGRKLKGTEGRPGAAASIAEKMRQETIGQERQRKGRVGGLVDRRFGEGRADLTPEQIQLERYTRERQKSSKRNNFSLEDEDGEGLTHMGQSLADMDDFGPAPVSDDEDMGAEMVSRTNFGGFEEELEEDEIIGEDGEKRKKTKAEIMQEIIAKSKQGRSERQRQAEEDEDAREALDAELEDLQMLLATSEQKKPSQADGISADRMQALQEDTDYDKAVKELIYDRRAKASERTKTEEELIEEEAKRLHEQEEARIKRMRGEDVDEDGTSNKKRKRAAQGDDLSDDFQSESGSDDESGDEAGFGLGVNASASAAVPGNESDSEDESDDERDSVADGIDVEDGEPEFDLEGAEEDDLNGEEIDDSEDDDKEDDVDDDSEDDADLPSEELVRAAQEELARRETEKQNGTATKLKSILKASTPISVAVNPSELKFTYPCPSSLDQLLAITTPLAHTDIPTALHRIRVLHHPRLNPANNEKLSKYLVILIDYVLTDDIPSSVADYCVTQIHELSQKYWEPSATHFLELLEDTRQAMYKKLDTRWTMQELKFFSLIGQVWSTSDAYHKVVTPSFLVIAQYLAQNSDASNAAMAVKLALCNIVARWVRDSKRYMPETMQTLLSILSSTSSDDPLDAERLSMQDLSAVTLAALHNAAEKTVLQFATMYLSNVASIEIFSPFLPHLVIPHVKEAISKAITNASKTRRPLSLQTHRPIPLSSIVPKFEENFSLDKKSYDRNFDRASDAKLKAELRDTRRGAIRVLRRDAAFEARAGAKERREKGAVYDAKIKKAENRLRQRDDN